MVSGALRNCLLKLKNIKENNIWYVSKELVEVSSKKLQFINLEKVPLIHMRSMFWPDCRWYDYLKTEIIPKELSRKVGRGDSLSEGKE